MGWNKADNPPKAKINHWSDTVVVMTNYGNVFLTAYFQGENEGYWQRPSTFLIYEGKRREQVQWWIEQPFKDI